MAGNDESEKVVSQLARRHAATGLGILAVQQRGKEVMMILIGPRDPIGDDVIRDTSQPLERARTQELARPRYPGRNARDVEQRNPCRRSKKRLDGAMDEFLVEIVLAGQQNPADDVKGGLNHLVVHFRAAIGGDQPCRTPHRRRPT